MRFRTFSSIAVSLLVVSLGACGGEVADVDPSAPLAPAGVTPQGGGAGGGAAPLGAGGNQVADEILVQWKPGTSAAGKANARAKAQGAHGETIHTSPMKAAGAGELEVMKLPSGLTVAAGVGALASDPAVAFAEPNWIYQHTAVANDPYVANGSLWGMSGAFGSQASTAWQGAAGGDCAQKTTDPVTGIVTSKDVWVGIIDEGYMFQHEDLAANAGKNPFESPAANGVDDDGNGYTDDINGWNFDGNNNVVFADANDDHGTHVAGTIASVGNNGKGVAGMCWTGIKLLNAKFLGRRGGTTANAVKAVDYFTDFKKKGLNIVATNNSWGGGGFSQALSDAIGRADAQGVLFIAAAGNETNNNDAVPSYPSGYAHANIIRVAALTSTGELATYSNYGATKVDLGAPGSGIWSSIPKSTKGVITSAYASYSGTSMATPHVTGATALYAGRHPGATATEIKAAILGSVTPTPSLAGKCATGGRLNVGGF